MKKETITISESMPAIASGLHKVFENLTGRPQGFFLLVFTEGRASYVANVDRAEAIREMKHLLELWEQGMPDIPAHEISD
jgi:hypothetical protein